MQIQVNIAANPAQGLPFFEGVFDRVNVLLGANGSGKSKLLSHLATESSRFFGFDRTAVLIDGGRPVIIDVGVGLNNQTMDIYSNPNQARERYKVQRKGTLAGRLSRTFYLLNALEDSAKIKHSDEVEAWSKGDKTTPMPVRDKPPIARLAELFSEVFPLLKLEVTENKQLYVRKEAAHYPVSSMSDGERQVFTLLADLVVLTNESSVFIVDEPELNLHPTLAEKLWTSIEQAFPNDIFIYATHSLAFALRSDVEAVFALGHGKLDMSAASHASTDLRPFLGLIPGIIRSQRCFYIEGDDASFDRAFYHWLLTRQDIELVPLGASTDVVAASSREGIWQQLSPTLRVGGIVDRDFKSEHDCAAKNVVILDYHEAESYLCHPDVVIALHGALGNTVNPITKNDVIAKIVAKAKVRLPYVVAQRVYARTHISLRLSVERSGLKVVNSVEHLQQILIPAAEKEAQKAALIFDKDKLLALIVEEERSCQTAIDNQDIDSLLTLFEGKELLFSLCKMAGCELPNGMINALAKHVSVAAFPHLENLRKKLDEIITK